MIRTGPGGWGIFSADGRRIGTVMRFQGNPPATRWVAFVPVDRHKGFPTRKQAIAWVVAEDEKAK